MKFLFLFAMVLFSITDARAAIPAAVGADFYAPAVSRNENRVGKRGFLERVAEKILCKHLKKMAKTAVRSGESYGTGLAIWGLAAGLLGAFSFVFLSYTAFYLPLALGLAGLTLSIWALVKASGWQNNKLARRLAIIGLVVNALVLIGAVALIGSF